MLKRLFFICALSLLVAAVSSCIFNPEKPPVTDDPPPVTVKFEPLTEKWHVLNNIQASYVKRRIDKYNELLDDNFTFFLSPGDVGGDIPEQWNRDVEITTNTNLFDVNYVGLHRCKSIEMSLVLPEDKATISWVEITPASAPDETWYTTTIFYNFRFDTEPDTQYEAVPGAKASFTVRFDETDQIWKLVEFRDLANNP